MTQVQLAAPAFHGGLNLVALGLSIVSREIDADRKRPYQGAVTTAVDLGSIEVNSRFDLAIDRVQKVLAMVVHMEAEQVVPQQTIQKLFSPREGPKDLAVGPGDVPELGDDEAGMCVLEHPWEQAEVKVLDEDKGRLGPHFLEHRIREEPVDFAIVLPVSRVEPRTREGNVAKRPEPAVGEAVVVPFLLLRGEPDPAEGIRGSSGGTRMRSCSSTTSRSASPLP